ncbi:hypothetical protein FZEAL_1086 [Fusarium zealandicum]|uniref:Ankyrin repeat protein n=1 Tax=Fusarium zealandicum TaxID=1053134 RepID=A0A8H4UTY4_9HYPO|nr:hypothetical protein FZEAL_1086 [Fusarium zealandicum]
MLLKRLFLNSFVLGLVAAKVSPHERLNGNALAKSDIPLEPRHAGINFRGVLESRAESDEEDDEDACLPSPCRGDSNCRSTTKKKASARSVDQAQYARSDDLVNESDTGLLNLLKRDIDRPEEGGIDAWFSSQWDRDDMTEVPLEDERQSSRNQKWDNSPRKVGIKGMCGCTSVIIADRKGAYMSHFWELRHFKMFEAGRQDEFIPEVIQELEQAIGCGDFDKKRDRHTKVAIYTKALPENGAVRFPKSVDRVKQTLVERIPGLKKKHIAVIPYHSAKGKSEDTSVADGKVIVAYDPAAEEGKAGFDIWAGTIFDGGKRIEPSQNNSPVLSTRWNSDGSESDPGEDSGPDQDDEEGVADTNNGRFLSPFVIHPSQRLTTMGSILSSATEPSEAPSTETRQEPISENPNKYRFPLHEIGQMLDPIAARLAWAQEAIAAGKDPNALEDDARWERNRNRPLHAALDHAGDRDVHNGRDRGHAESLDLIKFLIDQGADPRLRDCLGKQTPAEAARLEAQISPTERSKRFYDEAATILEEAEKTLNEKEKSTGAHESSSSDTRQVECVFCREDKSHNWHYWCYLGTNDERRTFQVTDNEVRKSKDAGLMDSSS